MIRPRQSAGRTKTGNTSSALCPFASQDHLVGTVTGAISVGPPKDRQRIACRQGNAALQEFDPAYDRSGSFASDRHAPAAHGLSASLRKRISERLPRYVRLVPTAAVSNRNKIRSYSSTSSARASNMGGTSMPSVLAVLTLMMSWYWVGTCTGRSAGFSPLSIRLM
jgi:hypothetical protein